MTLDRTPHALTVDARLAALRPSAMTAIVKQMLEAGAEDVAALKLDGLERRAKRRAKA